MSAIETYKARLPMHGYGTDDFMHGLRIYPIENLLTKALVQHNAKHSLAWLVYDLDSDTAMLDWEDNRCPAPNMIAINPENGHAHLFYGLEKPVHNYTHASPKALRYMAAIDVALTAKLGADRGYSKFISKNPIHERWLTFFPRIDLYDLDELADWLDLSKLQDRRRRLPAEGLGRNCTLFETLRLWAYRERRKDQQYFSEEYFREACLWRAFAINAEFTPPLMHSEVRSTARSVSRWTWRNMSAEGFRQYQRNVSKIAAAKRTEQSLELRRRIVETARNCPTLVQADIAALCGCDQGTVSRHLRANRRLLSDKGVAYSIESARRPLSDMDEKYSNGSAI